VSEILKELVSNVEGASGAILFDSDGEAILWHGRGDPERLRLRAAYLAVLAQSCRSALSRLNLGSLDHIIVEYKASIFVLSDVGEGCCFALELEPKANLAHAIKCIKLVTERIKREILGA
jgi:predicted regulator of Ras-like GTPase activity (Roadblock/LC7/MglB family)